MPEMDGYEATAKIKSRERFSTLPIIGLTAHALAEERQKCLDTGMVDVVTKPINPKLLFSALSEWVSPKEDAIAFGEDKMKHGMENDSENDNDEDKEHIEMPAIPDIDVQLGLERVAGNKKLYISLLKQFIKNQAETDINIKEAIDKNDNTLAVRLAHTIKGVSGNIGAEGLFEKSQTLEKTIKINDKQNLKAHLDAFSIELKGIITELEDFFSKNIISDKKTEQIEMDNAKTKEIWRCCTCSDRKIIRK